MYQRCRTQKSSVEIFHLGTLLDQNPASIPTQASLDKEIRVLVKNPASRNWTHWMNLDEFG